MKIRLKCYINIQVAEFYFDVTEDPLRNAQNDESSVEKEGHDYRENNSSEPRYRECIFGEEALRISPTEPYCLRRPIRRGHLNISQYYPMQQVQS